MAGAIISGLLNKGHNPELIRVIESSREKRLALENKFKVSTEAEFKKINGNEIIVLAVKPQQAESLLKSISSEISNQLILSIAAGIQIESIRSGQVGIKIL